MSTQVRQRQITCQKSFQLLRNFLRLSVSTLCYIRNVFPSGCFENEKLAGTSVQGLVGNSPDVVNLINYLEKGVFDAMNKQYLRRLIVGICTDPSKSFDSLLETYEFDFEYSEDGAEFQLRKKNSPHNYPFKVCKTKKEVESSIGRLVRVLITLTQTLNTLPKKVYITMKIVYNERTPADYHAPSFRPAKQREMEVPFLNDESSRDFVGNVTSPHHKLNVNIRTKPQAIYNQAREETMESLETPKKSPPSIMESKSKSSRKKKKKKMPPKKKKKKKAEKKNKKKKKKKDSMDDFSFSPLDDSGDEDEDDDEEDEMTYEEELSDLQKKLKRGKELGTRIKLSDLLRNYSLLNPDVIEDNYFGIYYGSPSEEKKKKKKKKSKGSGTPKKKKRVSFLLDDDDSSSSEDEEEEEDDDSFFFSKKKPQQTEKKKQKKQKQKEKETESLFSNNDDDSDLDLSFDLPDMPKMGKKRKESRKKAPAEDDDDDTEEEEEEEEAERRKGIREMLPPPPRQKKDIFRLTPKDQVIRRRKANKPFLYPNQDDLELPPLENNGTLDDDEDDEDDDAETFVSSTFQNPGKFDPLLNQGGSWTISFFSQTQYETAVLYVLGQEYVQYSAVMKASGLKVREGKQKMNDLLIRNGYIQRKLTSRELGREVIQNERNESIRMFLAAKKKKEKKRGHVISDDSSVPPPPPSMIRQESFADQSPPVEEEEEEIEMKKRKQKKRKRVEEEEEEDDVEAPQPPKKKRKLEDDNDDERRRIEAEKMEIERRRKMFAIKGPIDGVEESNSQGPDIGIGQDESKMFHVCILLNPVHQTNCVVYRDINLISF